MDQLGREWNQHLILAVFDPGAGHLRISGDGGVPELPFDSEFLKGAPTWQP